MMAKEDYLGKLEEKSSESLLEILLRQQKLLADKKIVKLPDKGERVRNMVIRIKAILEAREKHHHSVDVIQKTSHDEIMDTDEDDVLKQLVNVNISERRIVDQRANDGYINCYERIMRSDQRKSTKEEFKPYRPYKKTEESCQETNSTLTSSGQGDCHHDDAQSMQANDKKMFQPIATKLNIPVPKYDECLMVTSQPLKYDGAKLISFEEAAELMQAQSKQHQELGDKLAINRLLEKLPLRIPLDSEGYRQHDVYDSDSSNDDDDDDEHNSNSED